jgi:hypothetical protein
LRITNALEVLSGTGVVRRTDDDQYQIGSRLFEEWVNRQEPENSATIY